MTQSRKPERAKVWVLTREHNDHDQHGEYFVAFWFTKPSITQLAKFFSNSDKDGFAPSNRSVMDAVAFLTHLLEGGGRRGVEDVWFNLTNTEAEQ